VRTPPSCLDPRPWPPEPGAGVPWRGKSGAFPTALTLLVGLAGCAPPPLAGPTDLTAATAPAEDRSRISGLFLRGEELVRRGDLEGAVATYRAALAIAQGLAAGDPANAEWQRDVGASHDRIGYVLLLRGDLAGAHEAYGAALAIAEALVARDPANTEWQRDLAVSRLKIGDVHRARGDLAGALEAFRKALAIHEALARKDPARTEWQRDLIVANVRLAALAAQEGRNAEARARYGEALRIARALEATGRLAPVDAWMPADLERRLAALPP
jgi:tetratricopeptide (TPR) repeat protein